MQTVTTEQSSLIEDMIDAFFSPSAMFTRRAGRPAWAVYAIVTLLLAATFTRASAPCRASLTPRWRARWLKSHRRTPR